MLNRRSLITGLISFVAAAPAIVRAESLMKLPKPEKIMTDEEIKKLLNKIIVNSNWGKFVTVPNKVFWMNSGGELKIFPISDEELYI